MLDSLRQFFRREYDDECLSFSLFLQYTRRLNPDARRGLLRTVVIDLESECPPIASYAGAGEMANPGVQLHLSTRLPGDSSHLRFSPEDVASAQ